jgi:hypothetical protein
MDIDNLERISGMPKGITVHLEFDVRLQKITGNKGHDIFMSEGATFGFLLRNIFMDYPQIEKKYPPGALGFTINGTPPKTYTPIFEGDTVYFSALSLP